MSGWGMDEQRRVRVKAVRKGMDTRKDEKRNITRRYALVAVVYRPGVHYACFLLPCVILHALHSALRPAVFSTLLAYTLGMLRYGWF